MSPQAQETLEQKNVQPSTPSNQMLQLPKCTLYLTKETFFPTNTHINFSAPRFLSLFTANANGIRFASIARLSVNPNVVVSIGPKKVRMTPLSVSVFLSVCSRLRKPSCARQPLISQDSVLHRFYDVIDHAKGLSKRVHSVGSFRRERRGSGLACKTMPIICHN